ncbi:MAG: glutathione synthase [Litorilinea sp.]|nr:MAG: glutathione synthase [Litorilinea sp.]
MSQVKKIGLLVGSEWSFPPAFLEEVNSRETDVVAEFVLLGGIRMDAACEFAVLIDRISHEVPYYRTYLKHAMLQGAYVINNPFWWSADDKFFQASLAHALGVTIPRTVLLPMKAYPAGVTGESLRNLAYPLNWQEIVSYVGLPAVLKDVQGGLTRMYRVDSLEELIQAYDRTGQACMMVQQYITDADYVRCLCIGPEEVLPLRYDPEARTYLTDASPLPAEQEAQLRSIAHRLNQALGYDVNCVEFAIQDGQPYVVDFMNPAPDLGINHLTPSYFHRAVKALADFAIAMAQTPTPQQQAFRWSALLG